MVRRFVRVAIGIAVFALLCAGQQHGAPNGQVYPTSHGILKSISRSLLLVEVDDEHEMKFRITRKTKFYSRDKQGTHEIKVSALQRGQTVDVDMQTALDGSFEAMRVTLISPKLESPK